MPAWQEREADAAAVAALEKAGQSHLLARLLALRGVTPEKLDEFFSPELSGLADPGALPGVEDAAESILAAVRAHRKIVVFGDYDCDGVCATAILVKTLRAFEAEVFPFLPERLTEGYGMTDASVSRMIAENPDAGLVVTVDNGINSVDAVSGLKAKGIGVVVTDHHLPGPVLPDCPVVNPKVSAPKSLEGLCGAGVAFLVSNSLVRKACELGMYSGGKIAGPLIVLAGLATVTDLMRLRDQNRLLVVSALRYFRRYAPVGLSELLDRAARRGIEAMSARDFGFLIGPRVNAAGRLGSGMDALRLLLADDRETARELARQIDYRNTERKTVEQAMLDRALHLIVPDAAAQVIDLPDGHPGVAGIVAARLLERLSLTPRGPVPVCVAVGTHGSARAPEGWNVRDALAACEDHLVRYGGHAAAGGFSVKEGEMDDFREAFAAACAAQTADAPQGQHVLVDAVVTGRDMTQDFVRSLDRLAPFGEGNHEPVFVIRRAYLSDVRPLGGEGRHLALSFRGGSIPRAVWWNHGDLVDTLRASSHLPHDIVFSAEISNFGEPHVELRISGIY